ncbi:hypothetical protein KZO85_10760 [Chromohalobacter canadensis]|uniref:hypothetical protein n=1 Tax=Chromohalobacter canadensis TaxID=141389 RepID=UPI0021C01DF9|nr:hypothetical protein [Chromohalobacter canadensis]MCT8469064.1 hypothetical protein [Chromohalobacter canadensis]MCT8472746.1 hypothetical protein [Chromohalobacter canadensis]
MGTAALPARQRVGNRYLWSPWTGPCRSFNHHHNVVHYGDALLSNAIDDLKVKRTNTLLVVVTTAHSQ